MNRKTTSRIGTTVLVLVPFVLLFAFMSGTGTRSGATAAERNKQSIAEAERISQQLLEGIAVDTSTSYPCKKGKESSFMDKMFGADTSRQTDSDAQVTNHLELTSVEQEAAVWTELQDRLKSQGYRKFIEGPGSPAIVLPARRETYRREVREQSSEAILSAPGGPLNVNLVVTVPCQWFAP